MKTSVAFGHVLKQIRQNQKFSQEQLGFDSGYHRTYISMLERGQKSPSLNTIFRLASVLGIPPSEIIRRVEVELEENNTYVSPK